MSKKDEALKLALEALEKIAKTEYHIETPPIESLEEKMRRIARKVIPNLREALAEQPAQQNHLDETVNFCRSQGVHIKCIVKGCANHTDEGVFVNDLCKPCHDSLKTFGQPAQQEEKPTTREEILSMAREAGIVFDDKAAPFYERFAALVAAHVRETERKPWVGLTEKEKREARNSVSYSPLAMTMGEWTEAVQDATEAKLREKNHG